MYKGYDDYLNVKFSSEIKTPSESMSSSPELPELPESPESSELPESSEAPESPESESPCPSQYDNKGPIDAEASPRGRRYLPPIRSSNSESDLSSPEIVSDEEMEGNCNEYSDYDIPEEVQELFNYIAAYEPISIEIDYHLRPFIPNLMPTVGDVDALLKVIPPPHWSNIEAPEIVYNLGIEILDDPAQEQSEPALLHMQLRSACTIQSSGAPVAIVKTDKDIDKWIQDIVNLHINKPPLPHVVPPSQSLADIEGCLHAWSPEVNTILRKTGVPQASMDCDLTTYTQAVCNLFDIPIAEPKGLKERILALHTLFNVFSVVKNLE